MNVRRRSDLEGFDEVPMLGGHAEGMALPFDPREEHAVQLEEELAANLARKRQPGFTADWANDDEAA